MSGTGYSENIYFLIPHDETSELIVYQGILSHLDSVKCYIH